MILTLPWPPSALSPNARAHWGSLATAKKAYREACAWIAIEQGAKRIEAGRLSVRLTFVPPDRRRRDLDNCIASFKAGADGLVDVLGVDDSKWNLTATLDREQIGGFVRVEVQCDTP